MIELNDLSKKLGLAKNRIMKLVYMHGSTLKYEYKENKKYFNENEVLDMIKKGNNKESL